MNPTLRSVAEEARQQVRDYRGRFEHEITEHARDVGALRDAEAKLDAFRAQCSSLKDEILKSKSSVENAVQAKASEKAEVQRELATARAKVAELESSRELMAREMARVLGASSPDQVGMDAASYKVGRADLDDFRLHSSLTLSVS